MIDISKFDSWNRVYDIDANLCLQKTLEFFKNSTPFIDTISLFEGATLKALTLTGIRDGNGADINCYFFVHENIFYRVFVQVFGYWTYGQTSSITFLDHWDNIDVSWFNELLVEYENNKKPFPSEWDLECGQRIAQFYLKDLYTTDVTGWDFYWEKPTAFQEKLAYVGQQMEDILNRDSFNSLTAKLKILLSTEVGQRKLRKLVDDIWKQHQLTESIQKNKLFRSGS